MASACIELVAKSGAHVVGCGFLIEKMFDKGRAALPSNVMIEPLVRIISVMDGNIAFDESQEDESLLPSSP